MICPGTLAAKATAPWPPAAANSVMNRPPPETARVIAPHRPRAPAVAVVVRIWTLAVIHESSPGGATNMSPGSNPTSSTGMVVPVIRDCIDLTVARGVDHTTKRHCMGISQFDAVVIGAGIAGSTVAAALAPDCPV